MLLYSITTNQESNTRNKHDSENATKSVPQKTAQMFQTVQARGIKSVRLLLKYTFYSCYSNIKNIRSHSCNP